MRAGRQQLAYGEHRVLGTVGWTQVGRAWDALRFGVYPSDAFGFDVFAGRYTVGFENPDFVADSLFKQDAWLTGAYFKIREVAKPALDEIDLYASYDVQIDDLSDDQEIQVRHGRLDRVDRQPRPGRGPRLVRALRRRSQLGLCADERGVLSNRAEILCLTMIDRRDGSP